MNNNYSFQSDINNVNSQELINLVNSINRCFDYFTALQENINKILIAVNSLTIDAYSKNNSNTEIISKLSEIKTSINDINNKLSNNKIKDNN
jgi:hypothetical protein